MHKTLKLYTMCTASPQGLKHTPHEHSGRKPFLSPPARPLLVVCPAPVRSPTASAPPKKQHGAPHYAINQDPFWFCYRKCTTLKPGASRNSFGPNTALHRALSRLHQTRSGRLHRPNDRHNSALNVLGKYVLTELCQCTQMENDKQTNFPCFRGSALNFAVETGAARGLLRFVH